MTLDDIRTELRSATTAVPAAALRTAVAHADAMAPEIYDLADKFCRGVYLLPDQDTYLFYGLHVLAAARHAELYACLMKLLRQREGDLDELFPYHASISMAQMMLSVWDGDADTLFKTIEHADLEDHARWALFDVLTRLTFDRAIPRERTAAFLARFESTPLADDDNSVWWSWEDAVTRLGMGDLEPALRRVWTKAANSSHTEKDFLESLEELRFAMAHPGDPERLVRDRLIAVDDPVAAVSWLTQREAAMAEWRAEEAAKHGPAPRDRDPAKDIRLTPPEQYWLEGFLMSTHVPDTTLSFEGLDGLFTALIIGPDMVPPSEYLPEIWGTSPASGVGGGPTWDSAEQAAYVLGLLMKHWNAIAARRLAGGPIAPTMDEHVNDEVRGHFWADGFEVGIAMRDAAWEPIFKHRRLGEVVLSVLDLAPDITDPETRPVGKERRKQILGELPTLLQAISAYCKDPLAASAPQQPARSTKIGRNDPCPCGSGKKYKKCCGGAGTVH